MIFYQQTAIVLSIDPPSLPRSESVLKGADDGEEVGVAVDIGVQIVADTAGLEPLHRLRPQECRDAIEGLRDAAGDGRQGVAIASDGYSIADGVLEGL